MSIKLRRLLRALLVLVCLALIVWSLLTDDGMPDVDRGKARLVTDGEEYARTHDVVAVDATADSIYLNHGSRGIISVYDWDGAYCYSIVTTAAGNGAPELYCCGDRLYLLDKFNHVFVYEGRERIGDYPIQSLEQYSAFRSELQEKRNRLITVSGRDLVDSDGRVVMRVENMVRLHLTPLESTVVLGAFALVAGLFLYIFIREVRKGKSPLGR